MTLATRCSACGTSFRVVQDQLKVSGGWVRCGRCNEVFNALEALYEIDTQPGSLAVEAARQAVQAAQQTAASGAAAAARKTAGTVQATRPPAAPPRPVPAAPATRPAAAAPSSPVTPPAPQTSLANPASSAPVEAPRPASARTPDVPAPVAAAPLAMPGAPVHSVPEPAAPDLPSPLTRAAAADPLPGVPVADGHVSSVLATAPTEAAPLSPSPPLPPSEPAAWDDRPIRGFDDVETRLEPRSGEAAAEAPSFMRQPSPGRRPLSGAAQQRWRLTAGALALLLAVQVALAWRDTLAAQVPATRAVLAALCKPLGCSVSAPRQLAALAVEGSNLRQRPGGMDGYDLTVALRNRANNVVLLPAVELTLTDSQGQALIRRVLLARDWRGSAAQLSAGADITLQTVLQVADARVAGYTVEIFYP